MVSFGRNVGKILQLGCHLQIISVVRDVADRFGDWQQLTNYRDPDKKSGALGGDILKKQRFV